MATGDVLGGGSTETTKFSEPDIFYDAQGQAYIWAPPLVPGGQPRTIRQPAFDDYTKAAGYQAPRAAPTYAPQYPTTEYNSQTGDYFTVNPYTGAISYGGNVPGLRTQLTPEEEYAQQLELLGLGQQYGTSERLGGQAFQASENALGRQFSAGESAAGRQFSAGENALSRALTAGQFAATLQQQQQQLQFQAEQAYQQALERATTQRLSAAQQVANNISNVDPGALPAFYAAGGGNIANALASGASAQSDMANLGAARSLQTAETIQNPTRYQFSPVSFDPSQYARPQQRVIQYDTTDPMRPPVVAPPKEPAFTAPRTLLSATREQQAGGEAIPDFVMRQLEQNAASRGEAFTPRFAMGTPGMGDIPAPQQFISGDSTHPTDPTAGGARPELVTVDDPEGNARLSVDPLAEPEMPERYAEGSGDGFRAGALFKAIGTFLEGDEGSEMPEMPMGGMGEMAGGMGEVMGGEVPRFALGTSPTDWIQATDQPYLDRIRQVRSGVDTSDPLGIGPYNTQYRTLAPSLRARQAASYQTAFGIPTEDFAAEEQRYRVPGVNRGAFALSY